MKVLVIFITYEIQKKMITHIRHSKSYFESLKKKNEWESLDFALVYTKSSPFLDQVKQTLSLKYILNSNQRQLGKICEFITNKKDKLNYDWFIKTRPDIEHLQDIAFEELSNTCINSRVRTYVGPDSIPYGHSVGGKGIFKKYRYKARYSEKLEVLLPDDQFYIFSKNIVDRGIFKTLKSNTFGVKQDEKFHRSIWEKRGASFKIIGIKLRLYKKGNNGFAESGHINMNMSSENED